MRGINVRKPERVVFLDEFRGFCLLLMIFYHGVYDLAFIFGVNVPFFYSLPFRALQLFIACGFVFVSGISSRYSRSNIKRGVVVISVAMGMTLVTFLLMPDQLVVFGVLHMLGICMILHGLIIRGEISKLPAFPGFVVCLALFAITWGIRDGFVGFFTMPLVKLPAFLYDYYFLFPLGLRSTGFYSSDYFPLFPWVFLFFAGSALGTAFWQGFMPRFFYCKRSKFLSWTGRHTLLIYALHQPVLYGILSLVFFVLNFSGFHP